MAVDQTTRPPAAKRTQQTGNAMAAAGLDPVHATMTPGVFARSGRATS